MTAAFSGLDLSLGNLSRLSDAKTRSISPENFTGEKGKGGMATEGTGAACAARPRPGLEDLALDRDRARRDAHAGRHRRPGRHPADLDDAATGDWRNLILRIYWDDQEQPSVECPVGDFFACGWDQLRAGHLARGLRQPRQRLQLLLGDAVPQAARGSRSRTATRRAGDRSTTRSTTR